MIGWSNDCLWIELLNFCLKRRSGLIGCSNLLQEFCQPYQRPQSLRDHLVLLEGYLGVAGKYPKRRSGSRHK